MKESIYFFNENHTYGGAEKMFTWLSKKLYTEGYDIRYCSLYKNDAIDTSPIPTDCLNFKFYNSYILRNLWFFLIGLLRIVIYIRKNKIKYVVCFGLNSFYILGILKLFMGFKLIVSERGDPSKKRFSSIRMKLFSFCEGTVFQTEGAKAFYDRIVKNGYVIPNPVTIPKEKWHNLNGKYNVIAVGRIDIEQKRCDVLINVFRKVLKYLPEATLTLVGTGPDINKIRKLVEKYELEHNVYFKGFKKDVIEELKEANVYVLTSDFEGIPNSLLEAMAFGMPVVSTDCSPGGAAFLIKNNISGVLVPKGNEQALSDAIIELLKNPEKQQSLGTRARENMKNFDENIIILKWENVINNSFGLV